MNMQRYTTTTTTAIPTTSTAAFPDVTATAIAGHLAEQLLLNISAAINETAIAATPAAPIERKIRYSISQVVPLAIFAVLVSIITVVGNIMVMISFKIDKQLQTISNYFLFSLAIADFAIGAFSMPLFAYTTLLGYWPLGPHICDLWLALDYLASNASVLNLLIISFDRYFSVTRPLTYRARRTTTRAAGMIVAAWGISLLLWPPWIYSWPYIEGKRTVPDDECYIQFIETNHYITFGTAIAAFYIPVTVMVILYYQIWRETKKRQKDLPNLQAGKKDSSKRSNSSDETAAVNNLAIVPHVITSEQDGVGWRRPRSDSSVDVDSIYTTNANISEHQSRRSSTLTADMEHQTCYGSIKEWCIAWWHSGRDYDEHYEHYGHDEHSDMGCTPIHHRRGGGGDSYAAAQRRKIVSVISDVSPISSSAAIRPSSGAGAGTGNGTTSATAPSGSTPYHHHSSPAAAPLPATPANRAAGTDSRHPAKPISASASTASTTIAGSGGGPLVSSAAAARLGAHSASQDSVYTILIRLPVDGATGDERTASIQMIHDDLTMMTMSSLLDTGSKFPQPQHSGAVTGTGVGTGSVGRRPLSTRDSEFSLPMGGRRMSHAPGSGTAAAAGTSGASAAGTDIRIPLNAKIIPKSLKPVAARQVKKKKKSQEKRQESKAARTLSAILLSFILTWTPYNILVLIKPLTTDCERCIPQELWDFFYALCYINSLINPVLYALCNASFRRTYIRILKCKWHTRNREAMIRNMYN